MTALIGRYDDERALATVIETGFMLKVSAPHTFPVRPNPQITSSSIKGISYLSRIGCIVSK